MGVELVFFYGPPYAGKTLFYAKHYQDTHQRICPSAIFDSEPDITLRCLVLKIVAILKTGRSVVLDDENEFRHTRASYINLIKAKVPDCRFTCIEFLVSPHHARLQCSWAKEWNIAQVFLDERKISKLNPLEKEKKICQWFEEEKIDAPCDSEGFKVSRVKMGLSCDSPFKFDIPALMIQIEVLSHPEKAFSMEHLSTVINTWSSVNMAGRVIFLGNIQHSWHQGGEGAGIGEECCSGKHCACFDCVKEMLGQLALKVDTPLYFALADYSLLQYQFILPPQPGLIAWVQRLHTIDLSHKSSLYVSATEAHTKMAQSAGLKTLKIHTVLNNPKIVTAINYRARQSAVPICVSESTISYYGINSLPHGVDLESKSSGPATRPSPYLPLMDKARASGKQMEQPCVVKDFAMGRYHGVCFKNLELLEKYQELYKNTASPTDGVLCTPYKPDSVKSSLPSETMPEKNIITSEPTSPKDEQDVKTHTSHENELDKSTSNENKQSLTLDCIKIEQEDIEKLALSEGRYKKGKEIQHLIKNLTVTPDTDEQLLQISCTCTGSQGQHYQVFVVIGSQGINQAKCTCLDSASQTGQCKHVVAMLLKYVDKDEQTKKRMNHSRSFKRKRKRWPKMAAGWQKTVYIMSSRELLETANQIIQEHNQSHKEKKVEEKETKEFIYEVKTPREILSTDTSREISEYEENTDTSSTKRQESLVEDEPVEAPNKLSPRGHFTVNPNQKNSEEHLGYEETKRQRRSYGKSILDEMV